MDTFAKNIARGGLFNTHIAKLNGEDVLILLWTKETTEMEITHQLSKKKISIDLEVIDPEEVRERAIEVLQNIDLEIIKQHGTSCEDFYFFIERDDLGYLQDIFKIDCVQFDFDLCSVCYAATIYTTICGHTVCQTCFPRCKNCPLCRRTF
jgi:hypothetical protein